MCAGFEKSEAAKGSEGFKMHQRVAALVDGLHAIASRPRIGTVVAALHALMAAAQWRLDAI